MTVQFVADENFNRRIVVGLQRRIANIDVVRVQDVGLRSADDPAVLQWAADHGRVLLTHDAKTMRTLPTSDSRQARSCLVCLLCARPSRRRMRLMTLPWSAMQATPKSGKGASCTSRCADLHTPWY